MGFSWGQSKASRKWEASGQTGSPSINRVKGWENLHVNWIFKPTVPEPDDYEPVTALTCQTFLFPHCTLALSTHQYLCSDYYHRNISKMSLIPCLKGLSRSVVLPTLLPSPSTNNLCVIHFLWPNVLLEGFHKLQFSLWSYSKGLASPVLFNSLQTVWLFWHCQYLFSAKISLW